MNENKDFEEMVISEFRDENEKYLVSLINRENITEISSCLIQTYSLNIFFKSPFLIILTNFTDCISSKYRTDVKILHDIIYGYKHIRIYECDSQVKAKRLAVYNALYLVIARVAYNRDMYPTRDSFITLLYKYFYKNKPHKSFVNNIIKWLYIQTKRNDFHISEAFEMIRQIICTYKFTTYDYNEINQCLKKIENFITMHFEIGSEIGITPLPIFGPKTFSEEYPICAQVKFITC